MRLELLAQLPWRFVWGDANHSGFGLTEMGTRFKSRGSVANGLEHIKDRGAGEKVFFKVRRGWKSSSTTTKVQLRH